MPGSHVYEFGPFRFDGAGRLLFREGKPVPLAPKLADTLLLLLKNAGNVVGKDQLLRTIWEDAFIEEGSLTRTISILRKTLGDGLEGQEYIATISKRGYRFVVPVTEVASDEASTKIEKVMLAVLPFQNFSGGKTQEYFSDGLTEEMITELGRLNPQRLGVIARTSALAYKASSKSIQEIGRELGVAYILEGSARRAGNRVRIAAQLIQTSDQTHVWAESYERELGDILALQSDVAQAIARQIEIKLLPEEVERLNRVRRVDPAAYEDYLKGRYLWNQRTPQAIAAATEHFEKAIERDPGSALAYSALADCYTIPGSWSWTHPRQAAAKAKAAALKALELDSTFAEPYASLGTVLSMFERRWTEAELKFQKALELNPNYATAHHWYSLHLAGLGRLPEAIIQIRKAQELDPLSRIINTNVGTVFYYARQYDAAIGEYQKTLSMDPDFWTAHWMFGLVLEQKKQYREAIAEQQRAMKCFKGRPALLVAALARACALAGRRKEAQQLLDELSAAGKRGCVPMYDLALAHLALGDKDVAFQLLGKAGEAMESWFARLKFDPRMDSLRSNARYADLLRTLRIPE